MNEMFTRRTPIGSGNTLPFAHVNGSRRSQIHDSLREAVRGATTLEQINKGILDVVSYYKGYYRSIGFVAAPISLNGRLVSSNGLHDQKLENLRRLRAYTEYLDDTRKHPVFSSTSVIDDRLEVLVQRSPQPQFRQMWRSVVSNITDLYMGPGWHGSPGAVDEHEAGRAARIKIHYMESHPELLAIASSIRRT